jgi:hypothetical protein
MVFAEALQALRSNDLAIGRSLQAVSGNSHQRAVQKAEEERIKRVVSKTISPWYERNSVWGPFTFLTALVLLGISVKLHDLRWQRGLVFAAWPVCGVLLWMTCRRLKSFLVRWPVFLLLWILAGFFLKLIPDTPEQTLLDSGLNQKVQVNLPATAVVNVPTSAPSMTLPAPKAHAKTAASRGKPTFLGFHRPDEALILPPNSSAVVSPKPLSETDRLDLERTDREYEEAKEHLGKKPDQLLLHDLFLTDASASPQTTSTLFSGFTLRNDTTGNLTHIEYGIVRQLEVGVKYILFYVPPSNETARLCLDLADKYKHALDDFMESMIETQKTPGDSEQTSSQDITFAKRVFIYNETNLSPEQIIEVRNAFKKRGIIVILRSTDYLSNKKLEAKVRLLQRKAEQN